MFACVRGLWEYRMQRYSGEWMDGGDPEEASLVETLFNSNAYMVYMRGLGFSHMICEQLGCAVMKLRVHDSLCANKGVAHCKRIHAARRRLQILAAKRLRWSRSFQPRRVAHGKRDLQWWDGSGRGPPQKMNLFQFQFQFSWFDQSTVHINKTKSFCKQARVTAWKLVHIWTLVPVAWCYKRLPEVKKK